MIEAGMFDGLAAWHRVAAARDPVQLDAILADDVVFLSPVVHTPQVGRARAAAYLRAALVTFGRGTFNYVGEWRAHGSAVVEFEAELDGIFVNGVDMIWWNEAGLITRFKVMVRPLKGMEVLRAAMAAQLPA